MARDTADLESLRALRNRVLEHFVAAGVAPTAESLASTSAFPDAAAVRQGFAELAQQHELVLDQQGHGKGEIVMAMPFSAVPTPHRVTIGRRSWWANCAWDALGIPAALDQRARSPAVARSRERSWKLTCSRTELRSEGVDWVHFLVPARQFWDDIGFT